MNLVIREAKCRGAAAQQLYAETVSQMTERVRSEF
jgi:hypothetical protein